MDFEPQCIELEPVQIQGLGSSTEDGSHFANQGIESEPIRSKGLSCSSVVEDRKQLANRYME